MLAQVDSYKVVLHNPEELQSCFEKGWTYPTRPIMTNKKYPYKLLYAVHPDDFAIKINDGISKKIGSQIEEACLVYKDYVQKCGFSPLPINSLIDMLPVAVKDGEGNYCRGEINTTDAPRNCVNVYCVDSGEDKWVPASSIYPPSIELLRFPKLALSCRLAQVVPFEKANEWLAYDYKSLMEEKEGSLVSISVADRGFCEVYLSHDKLDLGFEMVMNLGLADNVPLTFVENEEHEILGKYPRFEFGDWVGLQLSVFGTKVSKVGNKDKARIKVHLQLDTTVAESVLDKLEKLPKDDDAVNDVFSKEVGDAVLVRYGPTRDRYRATIIQKTEIGYLVKLVDYGDFENVKETDLLKIPDELVAIPEAATPCYLVELLLENGSDALKDKLTKLVVEKNLICRIGHNNYVDLTDPREVRKCVVSLSTEDKKPLYEILKVSEVGLIQDYTHDFPTISQSLALELLGGESAYLPLTKCKGYLAAVEGLHSVWLHLEGDDARAEELTVELTNFYANWKNCPQLNPKALEVGTYVAAQQNVKNGPRYYRAQVSALTSAKNTFKVLFLDYGNEDTVTLDKMKPLPSYFGKAKSFALQVALPVDLLPGADEAKVCDFVFNFTKDPHLKVYLQHEDGVNYAWVFCMGLSLAHTMLKSGNLVKLKITPHARIPFVGVD